MFQYVGFQEVEVSFWNIFPIILGYEGFPNVAHEKFSRLDLHLYCVFYLAGIVYAKVSVYNHIIAVHMVCWGKTHTNETAVVLAVVSCHNV